ncbi:unnamed protein product [Blepharisma stoltei]|uniref:14-3-3 domain-containing protein n=1 Tax=Blepharisma stoltei TaxID=1481888 RepID=A0AAU9JJ07_9CILI|nr:unnamed protein product [Blepharisma stoltei]
MDILKKADLGLKCGRYEQTLELLFTYLEKQETIISSHLELLEKSFRFVLASTRKGWRTLSQQAKESTNLPLLHTVYKSRVTKEIIAKCQRLINLIDIKVLPFLYEKREKVRAFKLIGDAYRYIAEVSTEEEHSKASEESLLAYQKVMEFSNYCVNELVFLRSLLNFSVFYYEILDNKIKALEVAKQALNTINNAEYPVKEHGEVEQLAGIIKENMKLWVGSE